MLASSSPHKPTSAARPPQRHPGDSCAVYQCLVSLVAAISYQVLMLQSSPCLCCGWRARTRQRDLCTVDSVLFFTPRPFTTTTEAATVRSDAPNQWANGSHDSPGAATSFFGESRPATPQRRELLNPSHGQCIQNAAGPLCLLLALVSSISITLHTLDVYVVVFIDGFALPL